MAAKKKTPAPTRPKSGKLIIKPEVSEAARAGKFLPNDKPTKAK